MIIEPVITAQYLSRTLEALQQSRETQKDVPARKQGREHIRCSPRAFRFHDTHRGMSLRTQRTSPPAGFARIVVPAETRSPTLTVKLHSGPKSTSTLEPNLMYPIRSPAATTSPACL